MIRLLSHVRRFTTRDRSSMRRPFAEAMDSTAHAQQHEQQNGLAASIGHTAKVMANKGVKDDAKWMALIEDAKASLASLTPLDIALLVNALTRERRADAPLYSALGNRICNIISFFSAPHLAMIISAYAKANLMDDELYKNLKAEINRRLYEFTSPTELCMILNALARCKETDEGLLSRLANHIKHHIRNFIPQELALVAGRYHALRVYDRQLFDAIEERVKKHIGRFDPNEAITILAAYAHFDKNNKDIQNVIKVHIKEEHAYLRGEAFVRMVEDSNLSAQQKQELLAFEDETDQHPQN